MNRTHCLICGSHELRPLLSLSEEGALHGESEHNFAYSCNSVAVCEKCGHGQLESYSHDCFSYYEDEDWEMYWWYALSPAEVLRLRALAGRCPDRLNPECGCSIHRNLRYSVERLSSGVDHAVFPEEKADFVWLYLEERSDQVALKIDKQKGTGQATRLLE